jgi:hypothetical protein
MLTYDAALWADGEFWAPPPLTIGRVTALRTGVVRRGAHGGRPSGNSKIGLYGVGRSLTEP